MISILTFIKQNISWLKDLFSTVFTGVATVIALMTYIRAKETLLQPVRTEVIKKQTEILTEIIELISAERFSFDVQLDYIGVANVNTFLALKDFGFLVNKQAEIQKNVEDNLAGWVYCGDSKTLQDYEVVEMIARTKEDIGTSSEEREKGLERLRLAKEGRAVIERVYITKRHSEFFRKLSDYLDNPFLPKNVQRVLAKIKVDVHMNLVIHYRQTLKEFIEAVCKVGTPTIDPAGVYNKFNHRRISHNEDLLKLRFEIRKYLKIDKMP